MKPENIRKALAIAVSIYSMGMAFTLLFYGKFSLEVNLVGLGYLVLIAAWLWVMIGDEKQVQ